MQLFVASVRQASEVLITRRQVVARFLADFDQSSLTEPATQLSATRLQLSLSAVGEQKRACWI